ncbi:MULTISPECIES: hypothetical protein [unclassified Frankia]
METNRGWPRTSLDRVVAVAPSVHEAWVDAGFKTTVIEHGAGLGIVREELRQEAVLVVVVNRVLVVNRAHWSYSLRQTA